MDKYTTKGLPPAPQISKTTLPMSGLLIDTYGLDELMPSAPLTCLWLLHPRTRTRARMQDIACRTLHVWHQTEHHRSGRRGLVALSFDLPNHGSRLVSQLGNETWDEGNEKHAIDMAALVAGATTDVSSLMDLVSGYLGRGVDAHVCLGWSLGGHAAWWSLFGEDRMDGGVVVVGCPDYIALMTNRAQDSNLDTSPLLGSKYFPPDLLATLQTRDPKAILFGATSLTVPASQSLSAAERTRLREILDTTIKGKKILACSGAEDDLVPYARSEPLLALLKDAVGKGGWYEDGDVVLDDRVYEGVGHRFSADMVQDAVGFLVGLVAEGPRRARAKM